MYVDIGLLFLFLAIGGLIELLIIYRAGRTLARWFGNRFGYYSGNALITLSFLPFFVVFFRALKTWGKEPLHIPAWVSVLGIVLALAGAGITWAGVRTLSSARWWSKPKFQKEHKDDLIDTGIYGVIRHPTYLGQILLLYGVALLVDIRIGLVSIIALHFYLAVIHARIEEQRCIEIFGDRYRQYMLRTDRIIPWRWLNHRLAQRS